MKCKNRPIRGLKVGQTHKYVVAIVRKKIVRWVKYANSREEYRAIQKKLRVGETMIVALAKDVVIAAVERVS